MTDTSEREQIIMSQDMEKETFGQYIKRMREQTLDENGEPLSVRGLARRIEKCPTLVSKIERDVLPASTDVIQSLSKALNVPEDEIFAHANKIAPDIKDGFVQSEEPVLLAAFMRKATQLSPDTLELANRLIDALEKKNDIEQK
jgi:transcriptional regulator with XRE-family HTH domain